MALQHDIYGEMCTCGHMREEHTRDGHGECCAVFGGICECKRFTWKRFMSKDDRAIYIQQSEAQHD